MCLVILSTLLMSSVIALPTTVAATKISNAVPIVLDNPLGAGYAVNSSSGSVTGVFVSFKIPRVSCNSTAPSGQSVYWVGGIDGFDTADFEYVGVQEYCQQGPNSPDYSAISSGSYNSIEGIVPVSAGNVISASITVSGGMFHYTFKDVTTGKLAKDSSPSAGAGLDAAACMVLGFIPFSKFSPTAFGKASTDVPNTCDARIDGSTHALGKFGSTASLDELVLVSSVSGDILATPSSLSDGGSSFRVTWDNSS
jgi:hypothetical protein